MTTRTTRKRASISLTPALVLLLGLALGLAACGDTGTPTSATTPTTEAQRIPTTIVPEESLAEPTQPASDGWMNFTSEADGFSVDMPGEPKTNTQSMDSALGELTLHFFQFSDDGGRLYVVSYNDYPADMAGEDLDPESVLNDAVEATAQGSEVENIQQIDVQGNPGIEGEISVQGASHVWYRSILVKNRLYQLIMIAPQAEKSDFADEAQRFIESFTLLNQ